MQISDEQIEVGAKIVADWIGHDWDGLGKRDISASFPDFPSVPHFNGGQPALRKLVARIIDAALARPAEAEPAQKPETAFRDWAALLEFGYMKRYIDNLHACISRRPHSSAVAKNADAYISYCSEIEQSANSIRDTYEKLRAVTASAPEPQVTGWRDISSGGSEHAKKD